MTDARHLLSGEESSLTRSREHVSDRPFLVLFTLFLIYCPFPASAKLRLQLSAQNDISDSTKYICKTRAANKIKLLVQRLAVI